MLKIIRFVAILGNLVLFCVACYALTLEVQCSSDKVQLLTISGFLILSIANLIVIIRYSTMAKNWLNLFHKPELFQPAKESIRPPSPRDWDEILEDVLGDATKKDDKSKK